MSARTHLDGPGFVAWLFSERPELDGLATAILGDTDYRSLRRWRNATRPIRYLGAPDRVMCRLDLHEWEIPAGLWRDEPRRQVAQGSLDALAAARAERTRRRRAMAGLRQVDGTWAREAA